MEIFDLRKAAPLHLTEHAYFPPSAHNIIA